MPKKPSTPYLQEGSLVYRLNDDPDPSNFDEINVTMVNGSRGDASRASCAKALATVLNKAAESEDRMRSSFHSYLVTVGFAEQVTPKPGRTYNSSTVQALWECYLHARTGSND